MTFTIFVVIYTLSVFISNYTLLSNYNFYNDLSIKLYEYDGKYKSFLQKLYYFKLWTCQSCNVFWISWILSLVASYFFMYDATVMSLITFIFHKVEGGNNV